LIQEEELIHIFPPDLILSRKDVGRCSRRRGQQGLNLLDNRALRLVQERVLLWLHGLVRPAVTAVNVSIMNGAVVFVRSAASAVAVAGSDSKSWFLLVSKRRQKEKMCWLPKDNGGTRVKSDKEKVRPPFCRN
jgi:hypothetical protein